MQEYTKVLVSQCLDVSIAARSWIDLLYRNNSRIQKDISLGTGSASLIISLLVSKS